MPIKENNHRKKKREKVVTSQVRTRNEDFGGVALYHKHLIFVQSLSHVRLFATPWTAARQASLSFSITQSLLVHWAGDAIQPFRSLLSPFPSAFDLSSTRSFSTTILALHISWPKYWSFSFSISPSDEYSGLISFSIDWFDLIAVQWTLIGLVLSHTQILELGIGWPGFFKLRFHCLLVLKS